MSDDRNYFEFHDEESECPTEFSEGTVLTFATASECATASASVTMAYQPEQYWDWWILNDIEIALRNSHFRYRGSIKYRDTRDGIVISGIAQHYYNDDDNEGWAV